MNYDKLSRALRSVKFGFFSLFFSWNFGVFKWDVTVGLAQLWGRRKCKPQMNYDKLSRALRYYYNKRILHKTKGKRFTYKFNFNKLVMPNYPFINIRPNGVVPQSAPPVPTASSRFHFPPLEPHSPTEEGPGRFAAASLLPPHAEPALPDPERKAEPAELEESAADWRRELLAPPHAAAAAAGPKRKPEVVLPLFSRPGMFPEHPHSPFAVSPLPGRPGVLNVPISPALSLTPTLFSYSPSPGLSPFAAAGSSCFSFNPEEMKHYLHSQACSVFNYHLSPRTFPRYPLVVPPLQCPVPLEEQPQFPIKLQPPPAGRKNRERLESPEGGTNSGNSKPEPPRVKVEPAPDKEEEEAEKREEEEEEEEEEKAAVFARPAAPAWAPVPAQPGSSGEENVEKQARDCPGDAAAQERREDALMPPKLRLKRRWNGDSRQEMPEEPRPNGIWHLPKAVAAASDT
ncbi:ETS translocation variant 3 isoform X1 [Camarhynchus parvulus]|uniref:ETS translocation variant 3 isoform X1 n=1 Tax=Geospiza parvula TaxID=87175 RepID=UPI001237C1E0|nr:ETS translocation variant 3 isoform X1 [Camarhynchus parvulus]